MDFNKKDDNWTDYQNKNMEEQVDDKDNKDVKRNKELNTLKNKYKNNYFLLLQINDAVFPIGSYTHSFGLETYIQRNLVKDKNTALNYIISNLKGNFLYTELLSVRFAYEFSEKGKIGKLEKLDMFLKASKSAEETRLASEKLGNRFIRAVESLNVDYDNETYIKYVENIKNNRLETNYSLIYGVFCASAGIDLDKALKNFLYSNTSSMMLNCVKTVPLSQNDGQKILTECYDVFSEIIEKVFELREEDIGRNMPGFEIRSMQHAYLYSRLYIS